MPKGKKRAKKTAKKHVGVGLESVLKKITVAAMKKLPIAKLEKVSKKLHSDAVKADTIIDQKSWGQ